MKQSERVEELEFNMAALTLEVEDTRRALNTVVRALRELIGPQPEVERPRLRVIEGEQR